MVPGDTSDVFIANSPLVPATATMLGANMTIKSLTIADTTNGLGHDADNNTLTLTPNAPTNGIVMNPAVPASSIDAKVALGADQTWTNDSTNTLTAANIYTGNTTVNAGTLTLADNAQLKSVLGATGTLTLSAGDAYATWATSKGLTAANNAKGDDPDGDGKNNLYEFAFDGNPLSATNDGKVVGKVAAVAGNQVLTLTLPVRAGATFTDDSGDELSALIDGIYYRIEGSVDLNSFADNITEVTGTDAINIQANLPTPLTSGWTYRTFRVSGTVLTQPKAFLRAKISETP